MYAGTVILLLIVNIALVAFMVMGKSKKPQAKDGKAAFEKMVNELAMNEAQKKEFDSL